MKEKSSVKTETHPIYRLTPLWGGDAHNVWLASTLTLTRNLAKYNFPLKLDKSHLDQVVSIIYDGLKNSTELKNPVLFRSEDLSALEKEYLLEHFLAIDGFHQAHGGEGFIIDDNGAFLAIINIQNHLQLQLTDTQQEIEKCWNRLSKIEEEIGKTVDFAYTPRFGFLNADPRHGGTGLIIALFLHIPAIIHTGELGELLEREKEEEILATGLQGSPTEMIGDILIARNSCTLGLTEEYILTSLRMWATRAVVSEVTIRKRLRENGDEHIKNKVARALGLLTHSYQLEAVEALNALSLVELGIDVGWIKAPANLDLSKIFFNCRRAHLLQHLGKKVDIPELPHKRAEFLHDVAKELTLVI